MYINNGAIFMEEKRKKILIVFTTLILITGMFTSINAIKSSNIQAYIDYMNLAYDEYLRIDI